MTYTPGTYRHQTARQTRQTLKTQTMPNTSQFSESGCLSGLSWCLGGSRVRAMGYPPAPTTAFRQHQRKRSATIDIAPHPVRSYSQKVQQAYAV